MLVPFSWGILKTKNKSEKFEVDFFRHINQYSQIIWMYWSNITIWFLILKRSQKTTFNIPGMTVSSNP